MLPSKVPNRLDHPLSERGNRWGLPHQNCGLLARRQADLYLAFFEGALGLPSLVTKWAGQSLVTRPVSADFAVLPFSLAVVVDYRDCRCCVGANDDATG